MKKIINLIFPLTVALAASLGCASVNAAQTNADAAPGAEAASQAATKVTTQATQTPHGLTRREVYDELVKAEKDGTLARLNALYVGS